MKIVICASEVVPFAKTGGLADVAGALPFALEELGHEVSIIMPRYKAIINSKLETRKIRNDVFYAKKGKNIGVYFIDKDAYFNRDFLYGDKAGDYKDNLDRFSFYCRGALNLLKEMGLKADIIHIHDWQASLIPVYLKTVYKDDDFYKETRTVLTIHNLGYQGLFPKDEFPKLGLDWSLFGIEGLEFYDRINLLKGGIEFSDIVNTVSPTYSKEIQTREFGFGLEGVLAKRAGSLFGILNGIDYSIWNPLTDKFIAKNYSVKTLEDKSKNKEDLQKSCGLPVKKNAALFGIVSRLAEQKGFDIISENIEKICELGVQLVILGTGDQKYHVLLEKMVKKYPGAISLNLRFDDPLAHKIYAGSDIFLMPSKYEPCGLGQLISMRYGSIPLVFRTGGLADTVTKETGFTFDRYAKEDLLETIKNAIAAFEDRRSWSQRVHKAMLCDFSWEQSAKRYVWLYQKAKAQ